LSVSVEVLVVLSAANGDYSLLSMNKPFRGAGIGRNAGANPGIYSVCSNYRHQWSSHVYLL